MTGLDITGGDWLLVCVIGTVLGLDGNSWPQVMWSRPIVAGTLGGLLFGGPSEGFLVGAWLEIVASQHPPLGAARYLETGPAALVSGACYALSDTGSLAALLAAVWVGWTLGWVGMHSVTWLRTANVRLVADPGALPGGPGDVVPRHRRALRLDAARAAVLTGALFVPAALAVRIIESIAGAPSGALPAHVLAVLALAALVGSGARALGARRGRWPLLLAGGALGLAVLGLTA